MDGPASDGTSGREPSDPDLLRSLRHERDRFVGFAFAASDLLLQVAADGRIGFAAGAAKVLTGRSPEALVGRPFSALFAERDRPTADRAIARVRAQGRCGPITLDFDRGEAGAMRAQLRGCRLPARDDSFYFALSVAEAASAASLGEPKRDPVSGLLDADSFAAAAREGLANAQLEGEALGLTLLQLDGIAALRARMGASGTDELFREIGSFLSRHAAPGTDAGRLAEDKFGVVRREAGQDHPLAGEVELLSRRHDPVTQGLDVREAAVALDVGDLTPEDAARALSFTLGRFVSSPAGEFSIATLADGFRSQISDTVGRISRLKLAVLEQTIQLAFQPIVRLATGEVHHYEMLARFEPDASPFEMIQFAERIGMIEEVDLAICQRAITVLERLQNKNIKIAVNISGRSLGGDAFVEALGELLALHPKLRRRIFFEITESMGIGDLPRAGRVLAALREAGHRICLDDFGAGASCFPYLQALPVDFVKIDGAYVGRIVASPRDRAILKAMVALCRDLEVGTIAEMIEHSEQVKALASFGVAFGQGYLFGRPSLVPMPSAQLAPARTTSS